MLLKLSLNIKDVKKNIENYAPYSLWFFLIFFSIYYYKQVAIGGDGYTIGDWLINYSSGFVRRGLIGTALLKISDLGIPLLLLISLTQFAIFAANIMLILKIYQNRQRSLFWFLILFSPAFLLFHFYDLDGAFRKEILITALFAFFCLNYARKTINQCNLILISIFFAIAGLSHEICVFTLPFFLYLLNLSRKENLISSKTTIIYTMTLSTICALVIVVCYLFKGDSHIAKELCFSLNERGLDTKSYCYKGSSIWFLATDLKFQIKKTGTYINSNDILSYIFFFVLILIPSFFTTWWNKKRILMFVLCSTPFLLLFLIAFDWGRWIHILTFILYCLILSDDTTKVRYSFKLSFLFAGVIYLIIWSLPHSLTSSFGSGLFWGLLLKIL